VNAQAPLRIGVVGFGYWGPNLVRNVHTLTDSDLVAVCDASPVNLAKFSSAYPGIPVCASLDEMLTAHEVDAVVVATSAPSHHAVAKAVLEAGKHCFVEKPLTLTSEDAAELVDLAEQRKLILMVGHLMVYHSAVNYIKDVIDSGELGDVMYLYAQRLNLGKVRTEENAFWSLAPHDVSIVNYLLGERPTASRRQVRRISTRAWRTRCSPTSTSHRAGWPTST